MNYPQIFERVYLQPLCITPQRFMSIHAVLLPRLLSNEKPEAFDGGMRQPAKSNKNPYTGGRRQDLGPLTDAAGTITDPRFFNEAKPGVAVIPVYGTLGKNLSWLETWCGGIDVNTIAEAVRQAVADPGIHTIVADMATPGGQVTGVPELANLLRNCGKTTYAFCDDGCNSGGAWIASGCMERYVTPSSSYGSVGTYLAWLDESIRMQLEGVQLRFFAAGKYKGIGLDGRPMTADDEAMLQDRVNHINDQFKASINQSAPGVDDETLQGQSFAGSEAASRGLVSGLVDSWEEFLALI